MSEQNAVTTLLRNMTAEQPVAAKSQSSVELFALVYSELYKLAEDRLSRERTGHTLQPTALVHEVFLRLVSPDLQQNWESSGHFFAAAAQAMRRILIENARKRLSLKRGGQWKRIEKDCEDPVAEFDDSQLLDLDEALKQLAAEEPLKAKLVELRFFGGLSMDQVSEVLNISRATAHRHWSFARAWLFLRINGDG